MQLIGTRDASTFRVPADYFEEKPTFTPGVDPTTGGPVKVVEDFTDDAPDAPAGKRWRLDLDPDSRTYRRVVLVHDPSYKPPSKRKTTKQATLDDEE